MRRRFESVRGRHYHGGWPVLEEGPGFETDDDSSDLAHANFDTLQHVAQDGSLVLRGRNCSRSRW